MNNDKIKNKYEIEGAYGITIDRQSYWIPSVSPENTLNYKKKKRE